MSGLPRDPEGPDPVAATDAVIAVGANDALIAYDDVIANDAVYNDPLPKGNTANISIL